MNTLIVSSLQKKHCWVFLNWGYSSSLCSCKIIFRTVLLHAAIKHYGNDVGGHHGNEWDEVVPKTDVEDPHHLVPKVAESVKERSVLPEVDPDVGRNDRD